MKLSWCGTTDEGDKGIYFEDQGCGCCSYSPTLKGQEAIKELTSWIEELETELADARGLLKRLVAVDEA